MATNQPGIKFKEVPFCSCRFEYFKVLTPSLLNIIESSFIKAILISRWVFSMILADSATLIELAL